MTASGLPPGPRMPSLAQAVLWAHRYAEFTRRAHQRYGPTFTTRIGGLPTAVVTVDRDAIRRLMTGDPLGKRHANDLLRTIVGDRSVLVLEPAEHLQRRKLLLPPFHGDRVRAYAELMRRLVDEELDRRRAGEVGQVLPVAQNLTLEVILRAVLGISDAGLRARLRTIFDAMVDVPGSAIGIYYPGLQGRSRWNVVARLYWRRRDELDALLAAQIAATRADPGLAAREDILAMLVQARDDEGQGLTDTDRSRDRLGRRAARPPPRGVRACTCGTGRRRAGVPRRARQGDPAHPHADPGRRAARHPLEPFSIGPYTIPPGVEVVVNAEGLHHDPALYPEPDRLRPERFLERPPDYAFLPFGGGAHRCVGAALAQLEIKTVLGALLDRYEIEPADPRMARATVHGITRVPRGGGRLRVLGPRRRKLAATTLVA